MGVGKDRRAGQEPASPADTAEYLPVKSTDGAAAETTSLVARDTSTGGSLSISEPEPNQVDRIGDYQILGEIARGGMGIVYKAEHRALGRLVALKQIRGGERARREEILRFQMEGQAAAQLDHPGIVPVYDVGDDGGHPYIAMAYVDGPSLWQQVKERPLDPREAARILQQVALAVDYAHQRGIVHRDLKPQNILIAPDGQPKVTDFGIAKRSDDSNLTQTGQILGTPSYMPPEQASGATAQAGPLADVYSLGATLYCLLTGRPPFQSASPIETLKQVLELEPVPPRALNPSITKDLETICLKCLQKQPQRRYPSAATLAEDLDRFLKGEAISARPISSFEKIWRWSRRKPLAAGLLMMAVVTSLLLIASLWYRGALIATAEQLQAAQQLKRISEYHKAMSEVREASAMADHGWTWQAEKQMQAARQLLPHDEELVAWQSVYANLLMQHDIRYLGTVAEGTKASAIAFSPDGQYVAVGMHKHALEYNVSVYSVADGSLVNQYRASSIGTSLQKLSSGESRYQDGVCEIAWSPDGRWLVGGSRFGSLIRWDTQQTSARGKTWKAHEGGVQGLEFTADSELLITAAEKWKIWKTSDWSEHHVTHDALEDFAIYPHGRQVAVMLDESNRVDLIDLDGQAITGTLSNSGYPAYSPDGRFLATTLNEEGPWVALRLAKSGAIVRRWRAEDRGAPLALKDLAFLNDDVLLGVDAKGTLHFWNVATGQSSIPMLDAVSEAVAIGVHPPTRMLAVASTTAMRATDLYELRVPTAVTWLKQPGTVRGFDCSAEGKYWSVASDTDFRSASHEQRSIQRLEWDIAAGQLRETQHVILQDAWMPRAANVLARHPHKHHVAWFAEWLGLMISPVAPEGGTDRFVRYPLGGAPMEIDVHQFLQSPATQGARHFTPAAGDAVSLDAATTPAQLAIPFSMVPLIEGEGGVTVAVQCNISGSPAAEIQRGWFDDNTDHRENVRVSLLGQGTRDWYSLLLLTEPIVKALPTGYATIGRPSSELPGPEIVMQRATAFPFAKYQSDNEQPVAPDFGPVEWSPSGQRLWGLTESIEHLVAWDAETLELVATWNGTADAIAWGSANNLALAVGDKYVVCGNDAGIIRVFSANATGTLKPVRELHLRYVEWLAAAMSEDESWVVLSTPTGKVEVRSVPELELLATIGDQRLPVRALDLSHRGKLLAIGCDDGTIRLCRNIGSHRFSPWITLKTHAGPINRLRVSDDGRYLAAASSDATSLPVWDLQFLSSSLAPESAQP